MDILLTFVTDESTATPPGLVTGIGDAGAANLSGALNPAALACLAQELPQVAPGLLVDSASGSDTGSSFRIVGPLSLSRGQHYAFDVSTSYRTKETSQFEVLDVAGLSAAVLITNYPAALRPTLLVGVLARAKSLERSHGRAAALDCLYDVVEDELMRGGNRGVDEWLRGICPDEYSDAILTVIATITLPYAGRLPSRPDYLTRIRGILTERHGISRATVILSGLE